jgi:hypothetical protein
MTTQWLPIKTAPKDEDILTWDGYEINICRSYEGGFYYARCVDGLAACYLTHWAPLPIPPMPLPPTAPQS